MNRHADTHANTQLSFSGRPRVRDGEYKAYARNISLQLIFSRSSFELVASHIAYVLGVKAGAPGIVEFRSFSGITQNLGIFRLRMRSRDMDSSTCYELVRGQ